VSVSSGQSDRHVPFVGRCHQGDRQDSSRVHPRYLRKAHHRYGDPSVGCSSLTHPPREYPQDRPAHRQCHRPLWTPERPPLRKPEHGIQCPYRPCGIVRREGRVGQRVVCQSGFDHELRIAGTFEGRLQMTVPFLVHLGIRFTRGEGLIEDVPPSVLPRLAAASTVSPSAHCPGRQHGRGRRRPTLVPMSIRGEETRPACCRTAMTQSHVHRISRIVFSNPPVQRMSGRQGNDRRSAQLDSGLGLQLPRSSLPRFEDSMTGRCDAA
jgi:hypothetical protein